MRLFLLYICVGAAVIPSLSGAVNFKDVSKTLGEVFRATGEDFLKKLNSTVRDVVHKGVDDVKMLASQGFQALVLNYMNDRQKQKDQKTSRDISDDVKGTTQLITRILRMLDNAEQDFHYVNNVLGDSLNQTIRNVVSMATGIDDVKKRLEKTIKSHSQYADSFIRETVMAMEKLVIQHHQKTGSGAFTDFIGSMSQRATQALTPMIDGLKTIVRQAGDIFSKTSETMMSNTFASSTQPSDQIRSLLTQGETMVSMLKQKVMSDIDGVVATFQHATL
ncbi:uncharacterized protein LOC124149959 [Haliotis rufescens]|uniref:uncharacterized protein LOC124149959 n=1 Tax=Haliotis rufescens TaxID=6454 RepID=UPI00201F2D74|nr:uncharacterized protein LOC124149959 [Haliotis rufescens]